MRPSIHRTSYGLRIGRAGMTLVEVAIAIGIISFSVIPMIGLLSVGYTSYNHAIEMSVQANIVQQVRVLAASISGAGGQIPTTYYRADGTATTQADPTRLYEALVQPAASLATPAPSVLLVNQVQIIFVPSGQTLATEVIDVTPRH